LAADLAEAAEAIGDADNSVFVNRATRKSSTVPRHREINDFLARKICRDLVFFMIVFLFAGMI
jgi:hypothetical protein